MNRRPSMSTHQMWAVLCLLYLALGYVLVQAAGAYLADYVRPMVVDCMIQLATALSPTGVIL